MKLTDVLKPGTPVAVELNDGQDDPLVLSGDTYFTDAVGIAIFEDGALTDDGFDYYPWGAVARVSAAKRGVAR